MLRKKVTNKYIDRFLCILEILLITFNLVYFPYDIFLPKSESIAYATPGSWSQTTAAEFANSTGFYTKTNGDQVELDDSLNLYNKFDSASSLNADYAKGSSTATPSGAVQPGQTGKLTSAVRVEESSTNLYTNSGFESYTGTPNDGNADTFTSTTSWDFTLDASTTVKQSGNTSVKTIQNGALPRVLEKSFSTSPGATYFISAYLYLPSGHTFTTASLADDGRSDSTYTEVVPLDPAKVNQWQRIVWKCVTVSATTIQTMLRVNGGSAGSYFYVDSIQAEQKSFATSYVGENLQPNPSFESALTAPYEENDGGGATWANTNLSAEVGSQSLRLSYEGGSHFVRLRPTFTINSSSATASFWIKRNNINNPWGTVPLGTGAVDYAVYLYDETSGANVGTIGSGNVAGYTQWTRNAASFDIISGHSFSLRIIADPWSNNGNLFDLDAIKVEPGSTDTGYTEDSNADSKWERPAGTLTYPIASNLNVATGTIAFWFKPEWNGNDNAGHYLYFDSSNSSLTIAKWTNNILYAGFQIGGTNYRIAQDVSSLITANNWYHIEFRWNSSAAVTGSNRVSLFINGTEYLSGDNVTSNFTPTAGTSLYVGSYVNGDYNADALIDDSRIYNRSLSTTEISDIYNSGTGKVGTYPKSDLGTLTSPAIGPYGSFYDWGNLTWNKVLNGQTLTVDVLRASDNVMLATNVASGTDLSTVISNSETSIKLRANFTGDGANTPVLNDWSVDYNTDTTAPTGTSLSWGTVGLNSMVITSSGANDSESGLPASPYYIERDDNATSFASADTNSGWISGAWDQGSLTSNTPYAYRVKAKDNIPNESGWVTPTPAYKYTLSDNPTGAAATDGTYLDKINVSWSSGGNQSGYRVYRDGDKDTGVQVYDDIGTSFDNTITGSHSYYVYSKNGDGTLSNGYSTDTGNTMVAPNAPVNGTPTAQSTDTIRWNFTDASNNEDGFRIYDGLVQKVEDPTPDISYIDEGALLTNTNYTRQVKAYNGAGESTASADMSAYTKIEDPTGISFDTVGEDSITLSATGTLSNLTSGTSGIRFKKDSTEGDWKQTNTDTFNSLIPNTSYSFTSKTRNGDSLENSYIATSDKVTLARTPGVPSVSGDYSLIDSYHSDITLNTLDNPPSTEYAVSPDNGITYLQADGSTSATPYWSTSANWLHKNLNGNIEYNYYVKARNSDLLDTSFSGAGSDTTPPSAPLNLSAASIEQTTATVNWDASGGADSYTVSYGTDAQATNLGTLSTDTNSKGLTSLTADETYYYKVRATSVANGTGAYSSIESFTTDTLYAPSTILQFKTNGVTAITQGGYSNETSAIVKLSSYSAAPDSTTITPEVEVKPVADSFDGTGIQTGDSVAYSGTPVNLNVTVSSLINLTGYHYRARVLDNLGRTSPWAEYNSGGLAFTIDQVEPNVSITSPATNAYVKGTVSLTSSATDNLSMGSVSFYRDNLSTLIGTDSSSPYSVSWSTAGKDGSRTIYAVARDSAGNTKTTERPIKVDNYRPRTYAPRSASVRRNSIVRLYYRASDPYSTYAKTLKIVIKKSSSTKKTISMTNRRTNQTLYYSYRASLGRGTYYFYIYAIDQANNIQYNVARNKLVIR